MPSTETAYRMTLLLLAVAALAGLRELVFLVRVPAGSMKPTIRPGEWLLVRRLTYRQSLRRGDILVFRSTPRQKGDGRLLMIKRLIGLPGEAVRIRSGELTVNGRRIAEAYLAGPAGPDHDFLVPGGACLFLGDHRTGSHDARYWADPYIRRPEVAGRAVLRIWPPHRLGRLK